MKLFCALFGHKVMPRGWYSPGEMYVRPDQHGYVDGVGRVHVDLKDECYRCGETFTRAKMHAELVIPALRRAGYEVAQPTTPKEPRA